MKVMREEVDDGTVEGEKVDDSGRKTGNARTTYVPNYVSRYLKFTGVHRLVYKRLASGYMLGGLKVRKEPLV